MGKCGETRLTRRCVSVYLGVVVLRVNTGKYCEIRLTKGERG